MSLMKTGVVYIASFILLTGDESVKAGVTGGDLTSLTMSVYTILLQDKCRFLQIGCRVSNDW